MVMRNRLFFVFLFCLVSFISKNQDINYNPKSLKKDLRKLWEKDDIELLEINVPDSLYNDILLDKGRIYHTYSGGENFGFAYIGRIYSCRSGGCGIDGGQDELSFDEDFEYFDYYIIFNTSMAVEKIRVYNYQATHGHEIGGKGWLKQFIGYTGESKLEYGKNIDAISGATISANAITYNVQESSRYLALLKPLLENVNQIPEVMASE
ncbi:MAG: FMN-binding protein, partial [Cyclobacteriaceae bacterium]|nr:FMN-binding protein [Cyclobacteriaceae bacterium]